MTSPKITTLSGENVFETLSLNAPNGKSLDLSDVKTTLSEDQIAIQKQNETELETKAKNMKIWLGLIAGAFVLYNLLKGEK